MSAQPHPTEQLEDEQLALSEAMVRAAQSLDRIGVTAQDILDELPAARAEVLQRAYGTAFMEKLERQFKDAHSSPQFQQAREG